MKKENKLTKEQHHILKEKGTEMPFTGKYYKNKENNLFPQAAQTYIPFSLFL
jgi:peptide methionine sulfoxide reductase MsrB